jgi:anti-sigma regulatory factor (Ser/Thr protein kinase)
MAVDAPSLTCEQAAVLVSELATNSVVHAGTGFVLTVSMTDHEIEVGVTDGSRVPARLTEPSADHGRGLQLVDRIATSWRCELSPEGKTVFATLALPPLDAVFVQNPSA